MVSALAVVLVILVLVCLLAAIILMIKLTKPEPPARTHPARASSQQPRPAAAHGAHAMAAEAFAASDELAAQRRREGKQRMVFSPPMVHQWDLDGFEVPPLIMAELRQPPVEGVEEILLSTERTIFERIHAERQQLQPQSPPPPPPPPQPPKASAPFRAASSSIVGRGGAEAPAAEGGGATGGSGPGGAAEQGHLQLLRQLSHDALSSARHPYP